MRYKREIEREREREERSEQDDQSIRVMSQHGKHSKLNAEKENLLMQNIINIPIQPQLGLLYIIYMCEHLTGSCQHSAHQLRQTSPCTLPGPRSFWLLSRWTSHQLVSPHTTLHECAPKPRKEVLPTQVTSTVAML